jgi:phage regulator Rha-like protein
VITERLRCNHEIVSQGKIKATKKLVEVHGQRLTTTSLVIAELFGRPHGNVLKCLDKLISRVKFNSRNYIDLDAYDTWLLAAIRKRNILLVTRYPKQADRKAIMDDFVARYRAKHPRFTLVSGGAA